MKVLHVRKQDKTERELEQERLEQEATGKKAKVKLQKGPKVGVLVAFKQGNNVYIGYSKCCKRDKYDESFGLDVIAANRAAVCFDKPFLFNVPFRIQEYLPKFIRKCKSYYKGDDVKFPLWVDDDGFPNIVMLPNSATTPVHTIVIPANSAQESCESLCKRITPKNVHPEYNM